MLQNTFLHIPGIGRQTELDLWRAGVNHWNDFSGFLTRPARIGRRLHRILEEHVPASIQAVEARNAGFFSKLAEAGEGWRLYPEFCDSCVFLDIETTGLSSVFDEVTVVGLYDGKRYEAFVAGQNLDELPMRLQNFSVVTTFNGSGFDLRFLRLRFPDISLPPVHIDLRWITRRLGHEGGLKAVEKHFGISRDGAVEHLGGFEATVLWSKYLRGEDSALQELIAYNREDVVHLKAILEMSYDQLAAEMDVSLERRKPIYAGVLWPAEPSPIPHSITRGPRFTSCMVADLLEKANCCNSRIVGIDLTGSERRATGWALLEGCTATTKSIISDADLIRETLAAKPTLVSIDSPLSVPGGWTEDQRQIDPEAPIYRKCELALKRMGIPVFWCLLPTMRGLTLRGMRLAASFRKYGIEVIESYPGAAQDILGIPRKGTSLDELRLGLARAGIAGDYVCSRVSHDELDAITSALVGLFYVSGEFIGLGAKDEQYLIVPRSSRINLLHLDRILEATGLDPVRLASPKGTVYD